MAEEEKKEVKTDGGLDEPKPEPKKEGKGKEAEESRKFVRMLEEPNGSSHHRRKTLSSAKISERTGESIPSCEFGNSSSHHEKARDEPEEQKRPEAKKEETKPSAPPKENEKSQEFHSSSRRKLLREEEKPISSESKEVSSEKKDARKPAKVKAEDEPADDKIVEEMKQKRKTAKNVQKEILAGNIPPLFGKYDFTSVNVSDPGLKKYINLDPVGQPHTAGRYSSREFGKHKMSIIERLINNMMRTEDFTGKKMKTYKVVKESFAIIEKREKKNPIQVFVMALEHSAPREEITRLRFGGISVPKAVDISPARRLDFALRNICRGAIKSTYKKKMAIQMCLANEIIMASKRDLNSFAVQKRDEMERVASSAR